MANERSFLAMWLQRIHTSRPRKVEWNRSQFGTFLRDDSDRPKSRIFLLIMLVLDTIPSYSMNDPRIFFLTSESLNFAWRQCSVAQPPFHFDSSTNFGEALAAMVYGGNIWKSGCLTGTLFNQTAIPCSLL